MASCFLTSRFKYRLKSRPNPLQMYSATRKFPLRSRSRVRIRVGTARLYSPTHKSGKYM